MSELHIVFGASGALGSAVVHHLDAEGLPIRAVARNTERAADMLPEGIEIMACDATNRGAVLEACRDGAVVYNCTYVGDQMLEVAENIMIGSRDANAKFINPSNGLVFGPLQKIPAPEDHPQNPTSKRGKVRKSLEDMLLAAHERGEVQVCMPRLPTFYGAHVHGTFISGIFESAYANRKAMWLGSLDTLHDMIYLPDAAAACVMLALADEAYGQTWHVPGAGPLTARDFITRVFNEFGVEPKAGVRSRTFFQLAGVVAPRVVEMVEVMYQFEQPFILDGTKLATAFPDFSYTPHDVSIEDTVRWFKEYFASARAAN
jgi:nucleoside-diphosphate-sugar epimerase